ncbi:hypothetical protein [Paenibacillus sp. GCM10012303]|uniref:hypothetical protein n=1 Tax=Paenibacillus sp. GCM10012303 TaxID=3317340 RepID=UPI0036D2A27D
MSWTDSSGMSTKTGNGSASAGNEAIRPGGGLASTSAVPVSAAGLVDSSADIWVTKSGEFFHISSRFDDAHTITIETSRSGSRNGSFNFIRTRIGPEIIHANHDDITPVRTFNTVGANHGYTCVVKVSMAGHDKTADDLGSQWTDGTTTYTLLDVNGDHLTWGCPYTVTNGIVSALLAQPGQDLTPVSGAVHTQPVNVSVLVPGAQLYPSINNIKVQYLLDGKEITEDGMFSGTVLKVHESYCIMDYRAIIDFAQSHPGVSYVNDSVAGAVRLSIVYTFRKGGRCHISHNFKALQKLQVMDCGFLQSMPMSLSGHTLSRYMPDVKIKSGQDFQNIVDMTGYSMNLVYGPSDYADPAKPPNRYVDWLRDGSGLGKVGFTMGYIVDKTNSKNADRAAQTSRGWDMRSTRKSYPIAMSGLILNAGDYKTFMGYRNYLSPVEAGQATNLSVVQDDKDTYVYIDYHVPVTGANLKLPEHIGKTVSVIDHVNFTLHNDIVDSDGITFSITAGHGYAILKVH